MEALFEATIKERKGQLCEATLEHFERTKVEFGKKKKINGKVFISGLGWVDVKSFSVTKQQAKRN